MLSNTIQMYLGRKNLKKCLLAVFDKNVGKRWSSKYFITTPIFYVNAEPHIGHLYTAVLADAANRFQKLKNENVVTKLMVGNDEHGTKISQSATNKKINVKEFCDQISGKYKTMFSLFDIQFDDYVRTTDIRHQKAATALWEKIFSKNLIYKDKYSGWYCVADEAFVAEQYLDPKADANGVRFTLEDKKAVVFIEEINYKFKLCQFQDDLLHWLKGDVIKPKIFQQQLTNFIEEKLSDLSVSRPADRVPWGIPVPGDSTQTIYVWMDALSSYLCSNGYPESSFKWPPDVQILGKDILKFHGVFWPAFLMAADLDPPRFLYCHSHWLINNEKMSKSKGNVVDAIESVKKYTSDGLRYFLLRGGVPHSDGNFSESKVIDYLNAELCHCLGNLLNRCTGKNINSSQIFPALCDNYGNYFDDSCKELIAAFEHLPDVVFNHYEDFNFYKGIDSIMEALHLTNKFFQSREPWSSNIKDANHKIVTLHLAMEALRVCGILLQPIIPSTCNKLLNKLSVPITKRKLSDIRPYSWELFDQQNAQNIDLSPESVRLFSKIKAS